MSATDRLFLFAHLRAASGGWQALNDRVSALLADWPGARRVGSFMGVFGIGNHELFLLLSLPAATDGAAGLRGRLPADVELVQGNDIYRHAAEYWERQKLVNVDIAPK